MCDKYTVAHESSMLFDSTKVVWCVMNTLWCMNPVGYLTVLRLSGEYCIHCGA